MPSCPGAAGVLAALLGLLHVAAGLPAAEYSGSPVIPCNRNDTDLNLCIASGLEYFLKSTKNGLPEIGLGSLDPLMVNHLQLEQGSGKEKVLFEFQDVRFRGFSGSEVNSARMNVNDKKLEVSLRAPVYQIEGQYTCSGRIYELPLSSSGSFSVTMTDVTAAWMLYFVTRTTNSDVSVAVSRFLVDISPSNVLYRFDKKFDGDNSLGTGEAMDEFMNENALEIYNDVKPKLMRMLSELFLDRANQVLLHYPKAVDIPK